VDEFVDQSGIILDMNRRDGSHQWSYLEDGTLVHIASLAMMCLKKMTMTITMVMAMAMVNEDWPACSTNLNLIVNLWAIMKPHAALPDAGPHGCLRKFGD
jgi:hypothetical protein